MKSENSLKLLGIIALEKGWVSQEQLTQAINQQVDSPQKLGAILIGNGWLSELQLNEILEIHTLKEFQEDELQFGRIAIKNKFVAKADIENCLEKQIGSHELLGEILIANGFLTLQQCNAILKSQQRFLLSEVENKKENEASCPNCNFINKLTGFDSPSEIQCSKCKIVFELNLGTKDLPKTNKSNDNQILGLTVQTKIIKPPNQESTVAIDDFGKLKSFLREKEIDPSDLLVHDNGSRFTSEERYDMGKEIDRGGMGLILATKDLNIKREIVTKVLNGKYTKAKVLRFIREAQINGQLEHPNIVPVHDLGMNSNGQIYFTMKWVKGESLREILTKLDKADNDYIKKYSNQVLIEIVKKVCDALAYAHSKNIIHRDLKPDNIMVGEFGEVQLMDWGLAKVLGTNERTVEALEESSEINSEVDPTKTIVGTCLGTPEYMSPEQALGDLENMDVRTDVYGLGGVLHSCLSLATPVKGNSFENVILKVTSGRVNELPKNTPPELVAIVKKAMALRIEDRYQSINELSADLTAYQSGYSVSVKHDSFVEIFSKLIKRNKAFSIGALISILALISGLGVSIWQWKEAIKQKEIAEKNSSLAIENERKLQVEKETGRKNLEDQIKKQLKEKHELAETAVRNGREFLSQANATDHKFSTTNAIEKNRDLYNAANSFRQAMIHNNENEDARKGLYETGKKHFELSLWLQSFEQAESNISDIKLAGGKSQEIVELQKVLVLAKNEKEGKIRERINFLMNDAKAINRKVIHEAASKELISLKSKLAIELLKVYINDKESNCQKLAIDSLAWMEDSSVSVLILPFIKKKYPDGRLISQDLQISAILAISILKPNELYIYNTIRSRIWEEPDNINSILFGQIKLFYEPYAALMANKAAVSLKDVKNSDDWLLQGVKYSEGNEFQKAVDCFTKAIELNPENPMAYNNRGLMKSNASDYENALLDFNKAIQLNPNDSAYFSNRGSLNMSLKKYQKGIEDYNQAIALNPKNFDAYNNRGFAKQQLRDLNGAIEDFNIIINANPNNARYYINRGAIKHAMKDFKGALQDFDKALELTPNTVDAFANRANTKQSMSDYEGAIADFSKAIELNPELVSNYYNRGLVREVIRDYEGALSDFNKVISLKPNYEYVYFRRGSQRINLGDYEGAFEDFSLTVKQYPKDWSCWYGKAIVAYGLKRDDSFKEALAMLKQFHPNPKEIEKILLSESEKSLVQFEGLKLENKTITTASDYLKRGNFFIAKKKFKEAEDDLLRAVQIDQTLGEKEAYRSLLSIAFHQKDFKKQGKYYEQWLKFNPDNIDVRNDYAWFLVDTPDKESINLSLGLANALKVAEKTEFKSYAHLDTLAFTYYKNNKFEEAVLYAKKVISLLPENYTEEQQKDFKDKLSKYEKALKEKKQ